MPWHSTPRYAPINVFNHVGSETMRLVHQQHRRHRGSLANRVTSLRI